MPSSAKRYVAINLNDHPWTWRRGMQRHRRIVRWEQSWITWMRHYDNHTLPQLPGGTC